MGLTVLDQRTGKKPKKSALLSRNILFFTVYIDGVIMLITGLTLGDRVAHTVVVRKKDLDLSRNPDEPEANAERINRYASDQKARALSKKRQTILCICILVVAALLFVGFLLLTVKTSLNAMKKTEEYKLAYDYVVESKKLDELGITADQLKFNSYSRKTYTNIDNEVQCDVEIRFRTSFLRQITVTLHDKGDGWYVCKECTEFE